MGMGMLIGIDLDSIHSRVGVMDGARPRIIPDTDGGRGMLGETASSVLGRLKAVAEAHLGEPVAGAVVAVPAHFNSLQRQVTRTAGRLAGFGQVRLVSKPTAAALAHGTGKPAEQFVAVCYLGREVFDISIVEIAAGLIQVKATSGETFVEESLTHELLKRTGEHCRRCLAEAQMRPDQVDEVLLVGGRADDPIIGNLLRGLFGKDANHPFDAGECVALGAAVQAALIQGTVQDLVLLDVCSCGLLLSGPDGTLMSLIDRNSTIPTRKTRVFTTHQNNQTLIVVEGLIWEGLDWRPLAVEFPDLVPARQGVAQIEVTFEIDADGILSAKARDGVTGRPQDVVFNRSAWLYPKETSP
jgi:molecular chaperone DnaK